MQLVLGLLYCTIIPMLALLFLIWTDQSRRAQAHAEHAVNRMMDKRRKIRRKRYVNKKQTGAYFEICEYCGAALDPGEKCDCRRAKKERKTNQNSSKAVRIA